MRTLLKSERMKAFKSRYFWVTLILSFVLGALMALLYYAAWQSLRQNINEEITKQINDMGAAGSLAWDAINTLPENNLWDYINISLCDMNVLYLVGIVISIFVASDYSSGTIRHPIARGFSRSSIYVSRLLISVMITMLTVLCYVVGGLISGSILFGFSSNVNAGEILLILAGYFLLYLAAAAFYTMIAVLTKKTGYAVAASMLLPLLLLSLMKVIYMGNRSFDKVSRFFLFDTIAQNKELCLSGEWYIPFSVAVVTSVLCSLAGWLLMRRQEIK